MQVAAPPHLGVGVQRGLLHGSAVEDLADRVVGEAGHAAERVDHVHQVPRRAAPLQRGQRLRQQGRGHAPLVRDCDRGVEGAVGGKGFRLEVGVGCSTGRCCRPLPGGGGSGGGGGARLTRLYLLY